MLKQHNIFESTFILSASACLVLISVQYLTGFFGVWLPVCAASLFLVSVFITFRILRTLLQLNAPVNYEELFKNTPLKALAPLLPIRRLYPTNAARQEWKEYDTSELSIISNVLERKLVSSWYPEYISQDIGFPFACKELLDHAISRIFQITHRIDTPSLYIDTCSVLHSHLSEYKRAEKLLQLSKGGTFEQHYRLMHPIFAPDPGKKRRLSADHCANILRVLLKDLIPFDLWDTPHSELLVRILTKRLDNFIKDTLSNPKWINKKIINLLMKIKAKKVETIAERIETVDEVVNETSEIPKNENNQVEPIEEMTIESALTNVTAKSTAPILQNAVTEISDTPAVEIKIEEVIKEDDPSGAMATELPTKPVLRQRRGRQGKNEIKIYDRVIEGSIQTWDTDMDLRCISVGQDLLASLDGEISLSRLWEPDTQESEGWSPNPQAPKSPPALWFGEEDAIDMEFDSPPKSANVRTDTVFHLPHMGDLQSTVNQARHKIGDLQVASPSSC